MSAINLQCKIDEWYLARIYSNLDSVTDGFRGLVDKYRVIYLKPLRYLLGIFLSVVLLSVLSNIFLFPKTLNNLLVFVTLLGIVITVMWTRRSYSQFKDKVNNLVNHPDTEEVNLYTITNDGILINYFNIEDYNFFIKWEHIKRIYVVEMGLEPIYKNGVLQVEEMKEELEREFSEAKELLSNFDYKESIKQKDMYSLKLKTIHSEDILLPLPPSWEDVGVTDKFVNFVRKEVEGEFTVEEKENVDLLERFMGQKIT